MCVSVPCVAILCFSVLIPGESAEDDAASGNDIPRPGVVVVSQLPHHMRSRSHGCHCMLVSSTSSASAQCIFRWLTGHLAAVFGDSDYTYLHSSQLQWQRNSVNHNFSLFSPFIALFQWLLTVDLVNSKPCIVLSSPVACCSPFLSGITFWLSWWRRTFTTCVTTHVGAAIAYMQ